MSCTTDRPALRRGSILMEFVMVLPIYIFLFGAIFLIGELGLNALRISVGDRDLAMDAGDRDDYSFMPFRERQMRKEKANIQSVFNQTYRADESFQGAWSWQAAGRTWFSYRLRSWGSALVSYPFRSYGGSASGGGILATLVGSGDVVFHGKDFSMLGNVRAYNYYTLKRTELSRSPYAYRNWDSDGDTSESWLTDSSGGKQYWYSGVFEEPYADSSADNLDSAPLQGRDTTPDPPSGRKEYKRFDMFVRWSQ